MVRPNLQLAVPARRRIARQHRQRRRDLRQNARLALSQQQTGNPVARLLRRQMFPIPLPQLFVPPLQRLHQRPRQRAAGRVERLRHPRHEAVDERVAPGADRFGEHIQVNQAPAPITPIGVDDLRHILHRVAARDAQLRRPQRVSHRAPTLCLPYPLFWLVWLD